MRFSRQGPFWLTLIPALAGDKEAPRGVRVKFAPATRSMQRRAARASQAALAGKVDLTDQQRQLSDDELDALFDAGEVSSQVLIRLAILDQPDPEWEGVLDEAGKPMLVTEENVETVLANEEFFEAADRLYVIPIARRRLEKNGSSLSQNGTGGAKIAAKPIVKTARKRAPAAPTKLTGSKARPGKASGKS